jgi:hypothetical protein
MLVNDPFSNFCLQSANPFQLHDYWFEFYQVDTIKVAQVETDIFIAARVAKDVRYR